MLEGHGGTNDYNIFERTNEAQIVVSAEDAEVDSIIAFLFFLLMRKNT